MRFVFDLFCRGGVQAELSVSGPRSLEVYLRCQEHARWEAAVSLFRDIMEDALAPARDSEWEKEEVSAVAAAASAAAAPASEPAATSPPAVGLATAPVAPTPTAFVADSDSGPPKADSVPPPDFRRSGGDAGVSSARLARAARAGTQARLKLDGDIAFVEATPSLPELPRSRYYVLLRSKRGESLGKCVFNSWRGIHPHVQSGPPSSREPICPHAVFHSFASRAEVRAYQKGAGVSSLTWELP